MPLYEYRCRSCKKDFEFLQLAGRDAKAACPDCSSEDVAQRVSVFAAHSESPSGSSPAGDCGNCDGNPGACRFQ